MEESIFCEISPTAIVTSFFRTFTDIPYEKEIYNIIQNNEIPLKENKLSICTLEARYKLINKLLEIINTKQIVEIAAGYSSRGMIYSQKEYNYIELDLKEVIKNKKIIVNKLLKETPDRLHLIESNVINNQEFIKSYDYLDLTKQVTIINEGLLAYLTKEEKITIANNINNLLKITGGYWIVNDFTYKQIPQEILKYFIPEIIETKSIVKNITTKIEDNKNFNTLDEITIFFNETGFEIVSEHNFSEIIDEISYLKNNDSLRYYISKIIENYTIFIVKPK